TMSTSCVARGIPCNELAREPPTTYFTPMRSSVPATNSVISRMSSTALTSRKSELETVDPRIPAEDVDHRPVVETKRGEPQASLSLWHLCPVSRPQSRRCQLVERAIERRDSTQLIRRCHRAVSLNEESLNRGRRIRWSAHSRKLSPIIRGNDTAFFR